jgi:hypothetical protein
VNRTDRPLSGDDSGKHAAVNGYSAAIVTDDCGWIAATVTDDCGWIAATVTDDCGWIAATVTDDCGWIAAVVNAPPSDPPDTHHSQDRAGRRPPR